MTAASSTRFGSRTTAEDALEGVARSRGIAPSSTLEGKTAIVTGANSGLGVETARVLALAGAHVVMACRSVSSAESVAKALRSQVKRGSFDVEELDLSDLASVR